MITNLELLRDGDISPGIYGKIAILVNEEGLLYNQVKKYKRWNDIFLQAELLKALLYSKWTYTNSGMVGAYNAEPEKLLKMLKEVVELQRQTPSGSGEEFENENSELYMELNRLHDRIASDFFEINPQAFWSHSESMFYISASVLEWTDLTYRRLESGQEENTNRAFVRPVFAGEVEEISENVEKTKVIDKRNMILVSKEELANEMVMRNRISEMTRETEELTEKGVFDE